MMEVVNRGGNHNLTKGINPLLPFPDIRYLLSFRLAFLIRLIYHYIRNQEAFKRNKDFINSNKYSFYISFNRLE